jgi:uncharacterized protein (TIGR00297 family)
MTIVTRFFEYLVITILLAPLSLKFAKMNKKGSLAAFFLGLIIYLSTGFKGFLILLTLHIIGAFVTHVGYEEKMKKGIAQKERSLENVVANGLFPAVAVILSTTLSGYGDLFRIAYISSVAAATSDTVSSEIGELSPSEPRLITTFEKVKVGRDGAVSLLGTLGGLFGAALIAVLAVFLGFGSSSTQLVLIIVTISGFTGTTVDSILGATLERNGLIGNNSVNLISIGFCFVTSIVLYSILI